jgi:hypothetical protein
MVFNKYNLIIGELQPEGPQFGFDEGTEKQNL